MTELALNLLCLPREALAAWLAEIVCAAWARTLGVLSGSLACGRRAG